MSKDVQDNIFSAEQWLRILLMIGFGILSWVLRFLQLIVTLIQILFALVTGRDNLNVRRVGTVLSLYQAHIWLYLSYSTETRPFPFNDLPESAAELIIDPAVQPDPATDTQTDTHEKTSAAEATDDRAAEDDVFSDISFTEQTSASSLPVSEDTPVSEDGPVAEGENESRGTPGNDSETDDTEEKKT